ncbi:phosphoglycerate mutase-like protein [Russula ochroleuca]|uniref:Phosphoglycerate mutase-like protein n=1 Tax=Russula ochroleuca TaxID=152965 RepID=A0A9P5TBS9_9AGAM|nr:phosphoglycerate mutase-like protein [Russula ochroleuca]
MLTLIFVSFLFGARSALSSPYSSSPWDNYCNAPHVNASHYQLPEEGAELVHLTVMMRHHKRTPVALVPNERGINDGIPWDCSGVRQFAYDGGGARLSHSVFTPSDHPFAQQMWAGSCESGQLTTGGFQDSMVHGEDLWELYHDRLGFLRSVGPGEIGVRTTYVDRTKQVASGVLAGMDPSTAYRPWAVHAQPQLIDSLVPSYKCPRADSLVAAAQAAPFWQDTLKNNSALKERIDTVLGTTKSNAVWPNTFTFYQDVFTSRVCNDHPLPCNTTGDCVSEEDAAKIFELGNLEYDYLWHRAENAAEYNQLTFGVMFSELAGALEEPKHPLALYVAHDSSMVRMAAGLGIFPLRWPRLGSEFVIEVWRDQNWTQFVRVLYDGEVIGSLSWTPLDTFINLLRQQVPDHLFEKCASVSG